MRFDQAKRITWLLLLVGILEAHLSSATAGPQGSVTLAWNPSAAADVIGYRVYHGETSRVYSAVLDVSSNLSATISGLSAGTNYFFAVTAYTVDGLESPFS